MIMLIPVSSVRDFNTQVWLKPKNKNIRLWVLHNHSSVNLVWVFFKPYEFWEIFSWYWHNWLFPCFKHLLPFVAMIHYFSGSAASESPFFPLPLLPALSSALSSLCSLSSGAHPPLAELQLWQMVCNLALLAQASWWESGSSVEWFWNCEKPLPRPWLQAWGRWYWS